MPSRLNRRRFLLAVTTANPALIRKESRRGCSGSVAPDRTDSDRSFRSAPLALPAVIAAVTFTDDGCALKTMPQPVGSGALGTLVTVTYDPDYTPLPISSTTYCYDSARPTKDALSSVITYSYDPADRVFSRSRTGD